MYLYSAIQRGWSVSKIDMISVLTEHKTYWARQTWNRQYMIGIKALNKNRRDCENSGLDESTRTKEETKIEN